METQNKALAETILHLTAYHHFGKVDLSQEEITNPNVVKSALDYCLKNYKNQQARIDPDSAALDHWHSLFWFITLNYSLK